MIIASYEQFVTFCNYEELCDLISSYLDIRHLAERIFFLNILSRFSVMDKLSTIFFSLKISRKRPILINFKTQVVVMS